MALFDAEIADPAKAVALLERLRDALQLEPCHVTGEHTPDHHQTSPEHVCVFQRREILARVCDVIGVDVKDLPRKDHDDWCAFCHTYDGGWK